jgi:hypothetical protein
LIEWRDLVLGFFELHLGKLRLAGDEIDLEEKPLLVWDM